jgi:ParB-like chromosome segregation protein Spo0J
VLDTRKILAVRKPMKHPDDTVKVLRFHPLADIFPLMEGEEFDALVADIEANGQREPITLFEGKILDGRNRYRACVKVGIEVKTEPFEGTEADARAFVISKNIHRRHLTAAQKRELIGKLIAAQPEKSDRQIAKVVKADHKTVARARAEAEDVGKVPHVEKRIDTKGRKQPAARKKASAPKQRKPRKPTKRQLQEQEWQRKWDAEADSVVAILAERLGRAALPLIAGAVNACGNRGLPAAISRLGVTDEEIYEAEGLLGIKSIWDDEDAPDAAPVENAPPPDVGADNTLDDGLDIPESLRRTPKAAG